jgi:hypothetical protein
MDGFATLFLMVSHAKIGTSAMARQGARRHRIGTGSPIAAAIAANPLPCGGTWADALREAALPQKPNTSSNRSEMTRPWWRRLWIRLPATIRF